MLVEHSFTFKRFNFGRLNIQENTLNMVVVLQLMEISLSTMLRFEIIVKWWVALVLLEDESPVTIDSSW